MPQYRLRLLRPHDHGFRLVELDFPSDEDAISVIQRHVKGPRMELWRGERLIAQFEGAQFEGAQIEGAQIEGAAPPPARRGPPPGIGAQAASPDIHKPTQA